jgi:2-oxoglutarate dehydrogenase E2 component (dihydrolipoamide succinyltransferase)
MSIEIKVPEMGESIKEATLLSWTLSEGDPVKADDVIAELETDKATMEIFSPASGTMGKLLKKAGETVLVKETIGYVEAGVEAAKPQPPIQQTSQAIEKSTIHTETKNETLPPSVKKLVTENQIDPKTVDGSGKHGQVTKGDVLSHIEKLSAQQPPKPQLPLPTDIPAADINAFIQKLEAKQAVTSSNPARETIVPMSRLRRAIAERLVSAQHTAAILTTFNEVDMSAVMELRSKFKDKFKEQHNVGLGFMSFFTKASIAALKTIPAINAEIRETDIVYKNYYDIGVAVGGPKGLVVPIIRDADKLSFAGIEQEIIRLANKVKDGKIALEDMQGGTFSISNGGVYGSMMSTPILNPPQSGILGLHNIVKRAVVVNDSIVIRPMMYVALSYDHRIVDGKEAVQFLVKVKEAIEDPSRLLLEV